MNIVNEVSKFYDFCKRYNLKPSQSTSLHAFIGGKKAFEWNGEIYTSESYLEEAMFEELGKDIKSVDRIEHEIEYEFGFNVVEVVI